MHSRLVTRWLVNTTTSSSFPRRLLPVDDDTGFCWHKETIGRNKSSTSWLSGSSLFFLFFLLVGRWKRDDDEYWSLSSDAAALSLCCCIRTGPAPPCLMISATCEFFAERPRLSLKRKVVAVVVFLSSFDEEFFSFLCKSTSKLILSFSLCVLN